MDKYKCNDCGYIFLEGEQKTVIENYGEIRDVCPNCHGDYSKAIVCKICGKVIETEDEEYMCDDCVEEFKKKFALCYKISEKADKEEVKINPLISSLLGEDDIEYILVKYITDNFENLDCSDFIKQDKTWFAEQFLKLEG